jgi:hypothetical protein
VANATSTYGSRPDDGWGPVRSSAAGTTAADSRAADARATPGATTDGRATAGRVSAPSPRSGSVRRPGGTGSATAWDRLAAVGKGEDSAAPERGLPGWAALLVLIAISAVGGVIDMISGTGVRGGFNVAIIVASVASILLVRRSGMFPVVVAPPIVYSVVSGLMLYVRSDGLDDRRVLIDTAANWLVYGFPAVAAATAAVLIIAGFRLITHR